MLWIKDIVESTPTSSFWTNYKVDMISFVEPYKVVAKRNVFSTIPSAQNESELEGGVENEKLKCRFSQGEGIWIYKRSLNQFPFQKQEHQKKGDCGERQKWKMWKS